MNYELILMIVNRCTLKLICFLNKIRSITTDLGVERLICDRSDVLPEVFQLVDPSFSIDSVVRETYLLPSAIATGGWMHMWDGLLEKGLTSISWFLHFLNDLKQISSMRHFLHRETILRMIPDHFAANKGAIRNISIPSFAHWRW